MLGSHFHVQQQQSSLICPFCRPFPLRLAFSADAPFSLMNHVLAGAQCHRNAFSDPPGRVSFIRSGSCPLGGSDISLNLLPPLFDSPAHSGEPFFSASPSELSAWDGFRPEGRPSKQSCKCAGRKNKEIWMWCGNTARLLIFPRPPLSFIWMN